ncbi:MAG: hypothetical protein BRC45_16600 [Cyanobacteria bacterium QS_5_48_63]|nr:MAG: hypothetical protein BRC45_16600 [Cyanobacteria bacterium QS_5_48_63]
MGFLSLFGKLGTTKLRRTIGTELLDTGDLKEILGFVQQHPLRTESLRPPGFCQFQQESDRAVH